MIKNQKIQIIKFSSYPEKNGTLIPFYSNKSFPKNFKNRKIFYTLWEKKLSRADHAHSKCSQIIIPLKGKIKIKVISKSINKTFNLKKSLRKRAVYTSIQLD